MPIVTIALYENALSSSMSLPAEMITAAAQIAQAKRLAKSKSQSKSLAKSTAKPMTKLNIILASEQEKVKTFGGLPLKKTHSYDEIEHTDLVILPALWRNPLMAVQQNPQLIEWLKELAKTDTLICSVGSASNLLAEAGLLNNKAATTHWHDFDGFAQRYPQVQLQRNHLITQAGKVFCAGSVNSVADLMIYFIAEFYSKAIANHVERQFSPEIRQDYEQHLYHQSQGVLHHDEDVIRVQQWLKTHHDKDIAISEIAKECEINVRTLNRRFKNATGMTPNQYLQRHRINLAEELIKKTNLPLTDIALQVGYSDYSYFAATFKKWLSSTPKAYRQAVRGKLFTTND